MEYFSKNDTPVFQRINKSLIVLATTFFASIMVFGIILPMIFFDYPYVLNWFLVTSQLTLGLSAICFGIHMMYTVKQLIHMIEQGMTISPEDSQLVVLKKKVFLFFFFHFPFFSSCYFKSCYCFLLHSTLF